MTPKQLEEARKAEEIPTTDWKQDCSYHFFFAPQTSMTTTNHKMERYCSRRVLMETCKSGPELHDSRKSHSGRLPLAMPVVACAREQHRQKIATESPLHGWALVARAVTKKEALSTPAALAAKQKEGETWRQKGAWFEHEVRERDGVIAEAKRDAINVQTGHVHCLCV
jgi:hypothetical protein